MGLGEAEEKVPDRVIAGKAFQAEQRVQDVVSPQPFTMGEALRPDHHRHQEGGERVGQRNGVVGWPLA